jgi:hypothetical protein
MERGTRDGAKQEEKLRKKALFRPRAPKRSGFIRLTTDCVNIIRVLKKEGCLKRSQIIELTGISEGNIDRRLNHLRAVEAITLIGKKYRAGPEPQEEKIRQVMEQLRSEGFYCQSLNTISSIAGVTPEEAKPTVYRLAPQLKIRIGDQDIQYDASIDGTSPKQSK